MSIWNKVLLGFIFLAAVAFFYLGMRALKTQAYWRSLAVTTEFFAEKEQYIQDYLVNGGTELAVGGDEQSDQKLAELREYYQQRQHNLNVQPGMAWSDFQNAVLRAVAATRYVNVELLDDCLVLKREQAAEVAAHGAAADDEPEDLGIDGLRQELHHLLMSRGRVWIDCAPQPSPQTAQTGQVAVQTGLPTPHGIAVNTILYVFEDAPVQQGGQYLGEFKVSQTTDTQVALVPTMTLDAEELQALAGSQGPWSLYEIMPVDSHDTFADMDEAELRELIPDESVEEYLRDRKPSQPDDPPERLSKSPGYFDLADTDLDGDLTDEDHDGPTYFFRQLRDYEYLMKLYHRKRAYLHDLFEAARGDLKLIEDALADARQQERFRNQEKQALTDRNAKLAREQDAAGRHHGELKRRVELIRQDIERIIATNKALAARLTQIQLQAARIINERTRRMAQTGASGS